MHIQIEKPRLGVPVSLVVDDPAPCVNALYYFRLQVDREPTPHHEPCIPFDFLEEFVAVCQARGIRGKFSLLPYPAGLGSILDGWAGCDQRELARWLEVARSAIAPRFDITPEILTHTLALDLQTHTLLAQTEHDWLAERTGAEMANYFGAALVILKEAGFAPTGITQPCYFKGSRPDYARAVLESIRVAGGPPVTFYFVDGYFEGPPVPPPEVVLLERERGEAVVSILDYCHDYFWPTQRPTNRGAVQVADLFISEDGRTGRLAELAADGDWLVFVCHWQSIYSDGSRQGLAALDKVAARLARIHGARLNWLTLSEIARYRAASEGCRITARPEAEGWAIELDAALDCPDFTLSFQSPHLAASRIGRVTWQASGEAPLTLAHQADDGGLLQPATWHQAGERVVLCLHLRRGLQALHVNKI